MSIIASPRSLRAKQSDQQYYVYLLTNEFNRVIYTGSTGDLEDRLRQHRNAKRRGFTQHYRVNKLVYYEKFRNRVEARLREKQLKAGPRRKKEALINSVNPNWLNLSIG